MSDEAPAPVRPVRVVQLVPVDGIGGVEAAARSALVPGAGMAFALAPIAGPALPGTPGTVLAGRYRSPDDPRAIADAVRRVLAFEPDVVIGSLWRSVPVLLALKLLRPKLRLIYFLHLERAVHLPDRLWSAVGIALVDALWCDSSVTQQARLTPRQRGRSRVISFVTERLVPAAPRPAAASFVIWARLHRQKGIDRSIELIGALVRRGVDARFRIAGPDGGEREALEAQAQAAGLSARIAFEEPVSPAGRSALAADATLFLQLSRSEGMAMSVVEAMQLGLVPVVTAVGEMARYVRDGENGVIVDPDALDEAADRLAALLASPDRLFAMRAAAIATWANASLYRDDVAAAAAALIAR